jgi:UrcA family protein
MSTLLPLAALAVAALLAAPDPAATTVTASHEVRYDDLELPSPHGLRTLDQRIRLAAQRVCGDASDADVAGKREARRCKAEVLEQASGRRDALAR